MLDPIPWDGDDHALMAYARGWLDGYERAYADGHTDGMDASAQHWTECVRRANKMSERAGAAKEWRRIVLAGGNPAMANRDDASIEQERIRMQKQHEIEQEALRIRKQIAAAEQAEAEARAARYRGESR